MPHSRSAALLLGVCLLSLAPAGAGGTTTSTTAPFRFVPGDRVALVGGAVAERLQHDGEFEARLQLALPSLGLAFRNLGFSGDEVSVRHRTDGFPTEDECLDLAGATVVFAFFGFNESFAGADGVGRYAEALRSRVERWRETGRRVVLFSGVPVEDQADPQLPDVETARARLAPYDAATAEVAASLDVPFVDLVAPLGAAYARGGGPFTIDGVHPNARGNALLAEAVTRILAPDAGAIDEERLAAVREAVLEKDRLWFDRYRVTDGYNVYGGRSELAYEEGITNREVFRRELEILDAMCAQRDRVVVALARGEAPPAVDVDLPPEIVVRTNRPGAGDGGAHVYASGEEALALLSTAPGTEIRLFADESRFPELVNPVQMAFDPEGRLWVAVWPSYPHARPGEPHPDALLVLEDEDGDGRADSCRTFAGGLHNPTGFEFHGGGVLVATAPDLLFLRDEDGDGTCDVRERVLHGIDSADTHHAANSFVLGPDGALYFQEGTFHRSQIETVWGPIRNRDACVWRYEPRSRRVERYVAYDFANPHGHVFDRWGQDFVTDGTGNVNYFALPFSGHLDPPKKHGPYFPFFRQRSRPAAATEIVSSEHFPPEWQGNYLVANVIGFQGVFRYAVLEDGAGFSAEELPPVVHSRDPNFRPSDLEIGPDGALWILDWHNALIGHMQHHLRDPSRDRAHGRVYRVVATGRPPLAPRAIASRPLEELVALLADRNDRVRHRTRAELSGRPTDEVVRAARAWAEAIAADDPDGDHHRLEALWVQQSHGVLDEGLLVRLLAAKDGRARAAATRVLRQMRDRATRPLERLAARVHDEHPRVRLEAVVGLSFFRDARAAEAALRVLDHPRDRFLDYALEETLVQLEPWWRDALLRGEPLAADHPEGLAKLLARLDDDELEEVAESAPLLRERLSRPGTGAAARRKALVDLARLSGTDPADELDAALRAADRRTDAHADHRVMALFGAVDAVPEASFARLAAALERLAREGERPTTRRLAHAAALRGEGDALRAWEATADAPDRRVELLEALPYVQDEAAARALLPHLLEALAAAPATAGVRGRFVRVSLPGPERILTLAEVEVFEDGRNVASEGTATQESSAWGGEAARAIDGNRSGSFGDGGQTHTAETRTDPWWELDLGTERALEAVTLWNRTDGALGRRLDGVVVTVLDAARRVVFEHVLAEAPAVSRRIDLEGPAARLRRGAARGLGALASRGIASGEVVTALCARFDDAALRGAVLGALRDVPAARWPPGAAEALAERVAVALIGGAETSSTTSAGRDLLAFADELAPRLEAAARERLERVRNNVGPQVVLVRPVPDRILYDRAEFTVVAGRPVELVFDNVDLMPHNLVITSPGALATVGLAAEEMAKDPAAAEKQFVPERPEVLFATRLLQPGERETLRFTAPSTPADHPFVCTFPGHWFRMNGVMHVVAAAEDEAAVPIATTPLATGDASGPTARSFVRDWSVEDLEADLGRLGERSAARGLEVMRAASCLSCHAVADSSPARVGPDLREVVPRYDGKELLRQVLEPSLSIAPEYVTEILVTHEGTVVAGRVVSEDPRTIRVQTDPYQVKAPVEVRRRNVRIRRTSDVSGMPQGLLSTFQRGDILDLLAFLESLRVQKGN